MRESISVFFPAYNDEHTIGGLVRQTLAFLPALSEDYEVIAVNDGSRDGTGAILEQLRSEFPERFRIVTHATNMGYGGALQSGFAAARKDLVFYTDGDGQYDPAELRSLLKLMGPLVGCVNGFASRGNTSNGLSLLNCSLKTCATARARSKCTASRTHPTPPTWRSACDSAARCSHGWR